MPPPARGPGIKEQPHRGSDAPAAADEDDNDGDDDEEEEDEEERRGDGLGAVRRHGRRHHPLLARAKRLGRAKRDALAAAPNPDGE